MDMYTAERVPDNLPFVLGMSATQATPSIVGCVSNLFVMGILWGSAEAVAHSWGVAATVATYVVAVLVFLVYLGATLLFAAGGVKRELEKKGALVAADREGIWLCVGPSRAPLAVWFSWYEVMEVRLQRNRGKILGRDYILAVTPTEEVADEAWEHPRLHRHIRRRVLRHGYPFVVYPLDPSLKGISELVPYWVRVVDKP